jgi:phage shock protein PspC (stress-responsive transcriptional regulator)
MQFSNEQEHHTTPKPFRRSLEDRKISGVASGLAHYFNVDVTLVRVVLVALCLVSGIGVALYIGAWLFVPEEGSETSIATGALRCAHGN